MSWFRNGSRRNWASDGVQVAVLIPALDCERSIAAVVGGARQISDVVLVVDDGSSDRTAACAASAGAAVVSHGRNRGKGAALRTGMQWLAARGVTHAVTMDADGQHLSAEIPLLLAVGQANPNALVLGDRRLEEVTAAAPINRFGNRFANRWVEIACGKRLPDTQSGFRVYPVGPTLALGVRSGRFAFETEVLVRAARAGMSIFSVPIRVYYPPADERISHYRKVRDTVRIILVVVGMILRLW